ncbi:hypothetical protein Thivi_1153 [Thiocystis violascens DSM 198]|uniref:Uncharacterized protein n=2 Tax=Thiocystis violascens TaxID=73141 RepID=I3Y865_THIV6|nr:hypothetical protein Thivi_1153 [Thiocystis violascens DSM 198]
MLSVRVPPIVESQRKAKAAYKDALHAGRGLSSFAITPLFCIKRCLLAMLPPIDMSYIADQLVESGDEILRAFDESETPIEPNPRVILIGLERLFDLIRAAEQDTLEESARALRDATGSEPAVLLDHGIALLIQLAELARRLNLPPQARALERLTLPFCCWLLRRGGELSHPEPVINATAELANSLREPDQLVELFGLMREIIDGIGLERALESETTNPARPWRVLLLNRAIVATRSHQPALMEEAFADVVEHLPEDAPDFFREGIGQMEARNYPAQVREVMQRYFDRWCTGQRLH